MYAALHERATTYMGAERNPLLNWSGALLTTCLALLLISGASLAEEGSGPSALVREIERENPRFVERNADGLVVNLLLHREWCNRTNLLIVAKLPGLRELRLQGGAPDVAGVRSLAASPSLSSLSFACFGQLPAGVLPAVADLPNIRQLRLVASDAPSADYMSLAGMSNLTELAISYSRNFTDADLRRLQKVPTLRSLKIQSDALSAEAGNIIEHFHTLTNAMLSGKTEWHTNWHPRLDRTETGGPR